MPSSPDRSVFLQGADANDRFREHEGEGEEIPPVLTMNIGLGW
jgi:hypothetical protein